MTPVCRWFAKCTQPADKDVQHPTIGWVPICDEHLDWLADQPNGGPKWVPPILARRLDRLPTGHFIRTAHGLDQEVPA